MLWPHLEESKDLRSRGKDANRKCQWQFINTPESQNASRSQVGFTPRDIRDSIICSHHWSRLCSPPHHIIGNVQGLAGSTSMVPVATQPPRKMASGSCQAHFANQFDGITASLSDATKSIMRSQIGQWRLDQVETSRYLVQKYANLRVCGQSSATSYVCVPIGAVLLSSRGRKHVVSSNRSATLRN